MMLLKKKIFIPLLVLGITFTTVSFKSDFFEIAKQIEIFTTLFKELNMNYVDEVNPAELMDTAIKNMLNDLDPYTKYWNEQDVEKARIQNAGEYTGIGALVRTKNEKITIVEPYKGYPADKAGLKAGDEIIKIGDVDVTNYNDDAGELLKGAPNSKITITYKRQGKINETVLTRESIDVKAVPYYTLLDDKSGYIVLSKFNKNASKETIDALLDLKKQGADKLILDLRGNPGGLLSEAINVVNIFIPKGQLVTTTKSNIQKYNRTYTTKREPVDLDIPVVVLINGRSASASEIVSGSLQDLDRGVVVGARSFGKGLVQRPKKLTYGTQLKVTISRYYTPSGRCIQALDYRDGDAIRKSAETYTEFKTKNGRSVYDGGGIDPDVSLESAKLSEITKALLRENVIFDYATQHYYENPTTTVENFAFAEKDYSDFKKYLNKTGFTYETNTEKELKEAYAVAEKEELSEEIMSAYNDLVATVDKAKERALENKKAEIIDQLTDEIILRYGYREGLYSYYTTNNKEIKEAQKLLNNSQKYQSILGN
ncbi:S41 family peptidase [Gangjinia marincola]|uniref:S41 family peptidase n=1 Tax=Gangjinia marincola TaxID=578463 RepID=A0ABP3XWQ9_9FLAO